MPLLHNSCSLTSIALTMQRSQECKYADEHWKAAEYSRQGTQVQSHYSVNQHCRESTIKYIHIKPGLN